MACRAGIATALFPTLSALAAKVLWDDYRKQLSQGIRGIVFMTLPTSVLMMVLSIPIIRLVFEHGQFTPHDTYVTAFTLAFSASESSHGRCRRWWHVDFTRCMTPSPWWPPEP